MARGGSRVWGGGGSRHGPRFATRRAPWIALPLVALLSGCPTQVERPGVPPEHVLLITVASLRADHMSCYQYYRPTTVWEADPGERGPGEGKAIDDLAHEGVLFSRAFAPSPRTRTSLASLFTGLSPLEHGLMEEGGALEPGTPTVATIFAEAGFRTLAFVSGDPTGGDPALRAGFETFVEGSDDVDAMERAAEWLREVDLGNQRPVFVWVHLSDPTLPYAPGRLAPTPGGDPGEVDYGRLFADPAYAGPADGSLEFVERLERGDVAATEADLDHLVDRYDGEVARATSALRTFLHRFEEAGEAVGLWTDTLVVFAGLHGEALGERGQYFGHERSLREEVLRVPLFLRHSPSLTGQRVVTEMVDLTDLTPTLLDWFQLDGESECSGRSLLAITDSYIDREFSIRPALAVGAADWMSLRTEDWRLVWRRGTSDEVRYPRAEVELYDHRREDRERLDAGAGHPERVAELRGILEARLARVGQAD